MELKLIEIIAPSKGYGYFSSHGEKTSQSLLCKETGEVSHSN